MLAFFLHHAESDTENILTQWYNGDQLLLAKDVNGYLRDPEYGFGIDPLLVTKVIVGSNVTYLDDESFHGCENLVNVTFNEGVERIWEISGWGNVKNINIPSSVISFSLNEENYDYSDSEILNPFAGWPDVENINISPKNKIFQSFSNCCMKDDILLFGCKNSIIPTFTKTIWKGAFEYCTGLTSITIPGSVTTIGRAAFEGCTGLKSVNIANSVEILDYACFFGCTELTEVTLPRSLKVLSDRLFCSCKKLKSIQLPPTLEKIEELAFNETSLESIVIPETVKAIGAEVFGECKNLRSCEFPNNLNTLSAGMFWGCTSLQTFKLPDNIKKISSQIFYGCTNLKSITYKGTQYNSKSALVNALNNAGVTVDSRAFDNCGLES